MKTLARNKKPFTYCLYSGTTTPIYDEYGNDTGELTVGYGAPKVAWGNISPATGASAVEMFGGVDNYDKVIVTDDVDIPIDTDAVLFVGKEYETTDDGQPIYNYTVSRVARSLNFCAIAIREVKVNSNTGQIVSG